MAELIIYMAGYDDPAAAGDDYAALKKLSRAADISIDGMVLIERDGDGQISVKQSGDDDDLVIGGTVVGVVGGFALGLFFPPAVLFTTVIGGALGALGGDLVRHHHEKGIAHDLEDVMPPGTSAVIAVMEDQYEERVAAALAKAERKARKQADKADAKALKEALKQAKEKTKAPVS